MGKPPKTPKIEPVKQAPPPVTKEDESVAQSGDAERRRIAAMMSRDKTVRSMRPFSSGYKSVTGI